MMMMLMMMMIIMMIMIVWFITATGSCYFMLFHVISCYFCIFDHEYLGNFRRKNLSSCATKSVSSRAHCGKWSSQRSTFWSPSGRHVIDWIGLRKEYLIVWWFQPPINVAYLETSHPKYQRKLYTSSHIKSKSRTYLPGYLKTKQKHIQNIPLPQTRLEKNCCWAMPSRPNSRGAEQSAEVATVVVSWPKMVL